MIKEISTDMMYYVNYSALWNDGNCCRHPSPPPLVVIDSLTHPQLTQPTIDLTPLSLPIRYIVEKIIGGVIASSRDNAGGDIPAPSYSPLQEIMTKTGYDTEVIGLPSIGFNGNISNRVVTSTNGA